MKDRLISYVDTLFENVPSNQYSNDLKDEITSDMLSGYDDCVNSGMSPAAAYAEAIKALGNVDELIEEVRDKVISVREETGLDFHSSDFYEKPGAYNFGAGFERILSFITPENEKILHSTIVPVMWMIIVIVYFAFSFLFRKAWPFSWVIFLVGAIINVMIDLVFSLYKLRNQPYSKKNEKKMRNKIKGAFSATLWLSTTIVYFLFSFLFSCWSISWLIFLVAAIIEIIMSGFFRMMSKG